MGTLDALRRAVSAAVPAWAVTLIVFLGVIAAVVGTFYYGARNAQQCEQCEACEACATCPQAAEMLIANGIEVADWSEAQVALEGKRPLPVGRREYETNFREGMRLLTSKLASVQETTERNAVAQLGQLAHLADSIKVQGVKIAETATAADQTQVKFLLETVLLYTQPDDASSSGREPDDAPPRRPAPLSLAPRDFSFDDAGSRRRSGGSSPGGTTFTGTLPRTPRTPTSTDGGESARRGSADSFA